MDRADLAFSGWLLALERRHLAELDFAEVRRGLQALSTLYVERRGALGRGAALAGAGKRAAFALFYGPLHLLVARTVTRQLGAAHPPPRSIRDLGCGTGAAGAGWALEARGKPVLHGVEIHPWAAREARWSWRTLGLEGQVRLGRLEHQAGHPGAEALLLAYSVNEIPAEGRRGLLDDLLVAGRRGARVLVIEPIARRPNPWWDDWAARFRQAGGRADDWRWPVELPETLARLDHAAGLDHRELTARTLYLHDR